MRNLKKIFAVIMVVALMASMMVPALAAGTVNDDKAVKLNNIGLMSGMGLADSSNRIQGLIFAIKAAGKQAEVEALTDAEVAEILANVVDADEIPAYGVKYAAYAVKKGFTSGTDASIAPKVKFSALQGISATSFLTWILKIGMGYADVGTANAVSAAVEAKVLSLSDAITIGAKGELIRDDIAGILYGAAMTGVNKDGKTFIQSLIDAGFVTQAVAYENGFGIAPAPVGLKVESITAINNKQIQIKFNMALDSSSATDEANYEVKDKGSNTITLGANSASLSEDKTTVTLTLDNAATDKLTNSTMAKVTVKKALKDASGKTLGADYSNDAVKVYDGVAPEVLSVKATGLKTIEMTMSEPVYDGTDLIFTSANFEVKGGTYTYYVSSATASGNTITLTLGTNMQEGNIAITYNKNAEIQDYAGIKAFQGTITLAYAKDTTPPVVSVKEFTQTSVTLQFDKPVNATGLKLYHSVNGVAAYGDTQSISNAKTVTFNFGSNKIPEGIVKLFVVNSSTSGQEVTDLFGNKMANTTLTIEVTVDNTPPTVAETKLNNNTSYDITFSENIDVNEAKPANFSVKKVSDGKDAAFTVTNDGAKKVTLNFTLDDNTDYEITVKSMKDTAGNAMASSVSYVVNAGDNTAPNVATNGVYNTDNKTIYIVFTEPMNQTDMLNKAMYIVDADGAGPNPGVALDSDDTLTAISDKKVKLVFNDAGITGGTSTITLGALKDLAGKTLVSATTFSTTKTIASDTLEIEKAELIALNKVKITFNKELANFDNSEFEFNDASDGSALVSAVTIEAIESMTTNKDGKSEVVVVLNKDLPANALYETNGIQIDTNLPATVNTKSVEGTPMSADSDDVADKVAPSISSVIFNSSTQIIVNFDEAILAGSFASAGTNGFSVSAGSITSMTLSGSRITITGSDFTNSTAVTYTQGNLLDATNNNKLATVTKSAGQLVATASSTPNANISLSISEVSETYAVGTKALLDASGAALTAQTIGDFTFVVTGVPVTSEAGDQITVALADTGVVTVTIADAAGSANSLNGTVTITVTHVPTGAVETFTVTITGTTAVCNN